MKCGAVAWFVAASPRDFRGYRSGIAGTVVRHVTASPSASTSDVSSDRSGFICKVLGVQEERPDLP
jgi:hypothetical protein